MLLHRAFTKLSPLLISPATELRLPTEQGEEVTVSLNSGSEEGCLGWIKSSDNTDISELLAEVVV